jgi:hypothetical protein
MGLGIVFVIPCCVKFNKQHNKMQIYRSLNGGKPNITSGVKKVRSHEVSPNTLTATAAGLTFDVNLLDNYDVFVAAQTSAGTDSIVIPAAFPVGTTIEVQCNSAIIFKPSTGVTINGGADTTAVAIAANATAIVKKVSATRIIVHQIATSGALTAPTAA